MATNAADEFNDPDTVTDDVPQGGDTVDNSYATESNTKIPVVKDETQVEQPNTTARDPDSDAALRKLTDF
jgi:hypothetical protein